LTLSNLAVNALEQLANAELDAKLIENGYEPVAVRGKRPVADEWQKRPNTVAALAAERRDHPEAISTGLRTGKLSGIDIDLIEAEHVAAIKSLTGKVLGPTLFERRGAKGAMLCYRNEAPVRKITLSGIRPGGSDKERLIEVLGTGQQFVAYGMHPDTGRAYEWVHDYALAEPLQTPIANIPEVTPDKLREFARRAGERLAELGYVDVSISDPGDPEKRAAREAKRRQDRTPVPVDYLIDMLGYIDASCDRNTWISTLGGIQATNLAGVEAAEMDDRLLDIANAWSSKGTNYKGWQDVEETYYTLSPDKPGGSGFGSVWERARQNKFDKPPPGSRGDGLPPEWDAYAKRHGDDAGEAGDDAGGGAIVYPRKKTIWEVRATIYPKPQWVWQDHILQGEPNLWTGDSGAGKTTLAENVAVAVASGIPFLGHDTTKMPVYLMVAEDDEGPVRDNLQAIRVDRGLPEEVLRDIHIRSVKTEPIPGGHKLVKVMDDGDVIRSKFMQDCILADLQEFGGEPVLWVIDPLEEFATFDRHKEDPCRALATSWLREICRLGVTALVNDHPSKAGMASGAHYAGSVQLKAAFATFGTLQAADWTVVEHMRQRELTFTMMKARYAAERATKLYRIGDNPSFSAHRAEGLRLAANMSKVFDHVEEKRATGIRSYFTNYVGKHGPGAIAGAIGLPEEYVKEAMKALIDGRIYESRKADNSRRNEGRDRGGLVPADFHEHAKPGQAWFHDHLQSCRPIDTVATTDRVLDADGNPIY
jgi:hypothetical protein